MLSNSAMAFFSLFDYQINGTQWNKKVGRTYSNFWTEAAEAASLSVAVHLAVLFEVGRHRALAISCKQVED